MGDNMITETRSSKETYELGYNMGKNARAGDVYCLDGDLGVGKTVFALLLLLFRNIMMDGFHYTILMYTE